MNIWIATENENKRKEFMALFEPLGLNVQTINDLPSFKLPPEDGKTFAENAMIKANALYSEVNEAVIADDSGLAVDYLHGAPGIFSARYGGENVTDAERRQLILDELSGVDDREAQFVCVIAFINNEGAASTFEGILHGKISLEERGGNGFGYDPIFQPENESETLGELPSDKKNKISHRSVALNKLLHNKKFQAIYQIRKEGK